MYTVELLEQKTLKELKAIAFECGIVPLGDRRRRQTYIDALAGVKFPFLALLEDYFPGVEIDVARELLKAQVRETIRTIFPVFEDSFLNGISESHDVKSAILSEGCVNQNFSGVETDYFPAVTGITFSDKFLATYAPYFGEVRYKADATGQLNLLEPDIEDEPPEPDDFESLDAFQNAMALWDAEHFEPLEVSLDSMCEWAPCPDVWYEPDILLEPSEVLEFSPSAEFVVEDTKRCPCGAMPAAQCDGTTATHIYPDRIVFTPCYKTFDDAATGFVRSDRGCCRGRSPPGGDVN